MTEWSQLEVVDSLRAALDESGEARAHIPHGLSPAERAQLVCIFARAFDVLSNERPNLAISLQLGDEVGTVCESVFVVTDPGEIDEAVE